MNHIQIPATGRDLYLPSDLSECDSRQYIEMAALILQYQCQEISYHDFRVHAIYKLLDMEQGKPGIYDDDKFSNIYRLSQLIDSFFEEGEDKARVIKQYYINNPVPDFFDTTTYYGPTDEFNNIKFGEYVDGLNHFIDFHETGDIQYLYLLLATFYRQKKKNIAALKLLDQYDGDKRVAYNPDSVSVRAKQFKKQHIGIVFGFYLLFASFQKYMTTASLFIGGKEIDLSLLFDDAKPAGQKESELPGIGMKSLMYSFAESGVYGALKEVREIPLWEALTRMYDLNKRSKDFEANQPK